MAMLKHQRNESPAEYVNVGYSIFLETLDFLTRISVRYQRLLAADTMHQANLVMINTESANSIRVNDDVTYNLRKKYLLEARAALTSLDVMLTRIYRIMLTNPQGCFTNTKGNTLSPKEAVRRLDNMADELGNNIDLENELITGVIDSDRDRYRRRIRNQ